MSASLELVPLQGPCESVTSMREGTSPTPRPEDAVRLGGTAVDAAVCDHARLDLAPSVRTRNDWSPTRQVRRQLPVRMPLKMPLTSANRSPGFKPASTSKPREMERGHSGATRSANALSTGRDPQGVADRRAVVAPRCFAPTRGAPESRKAQSRVEITRAGNTTSCKLDGATGELPAVTAVWPLRMSRAMLPAAV